MYFTLDLVFQMELFSRIKEYLFYLLDNSKVIFINYFRKTTASSTATNNTSLTIWFRINVLSGTNSIRKDVLFRENVLAGTQCESHTARDAPAVCREPASDRNGTCRFPFSLGRCHGVTAGYDTARPGARTKNVRSWRQLRTFFGST